MGIFAKIIGFLQRFDKPKEQPKPEAKKRRRKEAKEHIEQSSTKKCSACGKEKSITEFAFRGNKIRRGQCRSCVAEYMRSYNKRGGMAVPDTKKCVNCGESRPLDAYGRHASTKDGLHTWCRRCMGVKANQNKVLAIKTVKDAIDTLFGNGETFTRQDIITTTGLTYGTVHNAITTLVVNKYITIVHGRVHKLRYRVAVVAPSQLKYRTDNKGNVLSVESVN